MTWGTFFSSPPIKAGAIAGGMGVIFGIGGSAFIALNLSSKCSVAVDDFLSTLGENVTISELTAMLSVRGHSTLVTLTDINAVLPASVSNIIANLDDIPKYCFVAPFTIGVCLTLAASMALASCVLVGVDIHERKKEDEESSHYAFTPLNS